VTNTLGEPRCPVCGERCTYDEVDIGVGTLRGNLRCDSCGWIREQSIDGCFGFAEEDHEQSV